MGKGVGGGGVQFKNKVEAFVAADKREVDQAIDAELPDGLEAAVAQVLAEFHGEATGNQTLVTSEFGRVETHSRLKNQALFGATLLQLEDVCFGVDVVNVVDAAAHDGRLDVGKGRPNVQHGHALLGHHGGFGGRMSGRKNATPLEGNPRKRRREGVRQVSKRRATRLRRLWPVSSEVWRLLTWCVG